jgi:hypothetical protein
MRNRIAFVALLAALVSATLIYSTGAQQVIQPAAPGTVQVQPPGAVGTTQIPFVLSTDSGGAAVATVTVPALGGKQIYVTGWEVMGDGATGQSVIAITLGWGGTTFGTYRYNVVAGVTTAQPNLFVEYSVPITAGSPGANCVLTVPSFGAGNTASSAVLHGFYQ